MIEDKNKLLELPKGWVWIKLGENIEKVPLTGKKLKQQEYQEKGRLPVVDQGRDFIGGYTDKEKLKITCERPVIIFGDHTKIVKYVDFVAGADGVKVIKPPQNAYSAKLFYYFIQAVPLPDKGYARHFQFLEKSLIPLPPLPEQQRIVAKIEELFTGLDAGVEALKKAKAQLKRYRQAVLKHAFEGKLTEEWRKIHKGEIEPASALLERIKEEQKANAKGKKTRAVIARSGVSQGPEQSEGGEAISEIASPLARNDNLPPLPEGWVWTNVRGIGEVSGGLTKNPKRKKYSQKVPYLRVANVYAGKLQLDDIENIGVKTEEIEKVLLKKGDMLVVEGNGSIDQIGRVALWDGSISPCAHQNHIIKVRFLPVEIGKYVLHWLLSAGGRKQITYIASSTSGLYTLSISKVSTLAIPLSPLSEQHKIVEEIERRFSVAEEVEKTIEQGLKQAEKLRQSILKKAFEGRLVPQDPSDEPANALLEKIHLQRQQVEQDIKPRRKKARG